MRPRARFLSVVTTSLCAWTLALASAPAAQTGVDELPQARTTEEVLLRNLADTDGVETMRLPSGVPVRVHRSAGAWTLVEPPGGVTAWVSGRFLRPLDENGLHEVTRNAINLRPRPESSLNSYPLPVRLQAGDQVVLIGRKDPSLPLAEDWAQVRAPRGVPAYARTQDLEPLTAPVDAEAWQTWVDRLAGVARPEQPTPSPTPTPTPAEVEQEEPASTPEQPTSSAQQAQTALAEADALHEASLELERPDFESLRAAYEAVIDLAPASDAAVRARDRIGLLEARARAAEIESLLQEAQVAREQEFRNRQHEIEQRARAADPLGPRFTARGRLERRGRVGEPGRFVLRWGHEDVYELHCDSGRYDLSHFAGYLIGVRGETAESLQAGAPPRLDVAKIAVLARR